jgi:ornithine cyclodeaminase/alanine dehydrogenase
VEEIRFLYLSQEDIVSLHLSWQEIIGRVELGLREHGEKTVENPPKPGVHSKGNSFIHAMPAYLKKSNAIGMKWVSGYPDNQKVGIPSITGLLVLNCPQTGKVLAVMDCRWITAVRTAAVTALTVQHFARREARVLGIVGAGVQGLMNYTVLTKLFPSLETCKIFDIKAEAMGSMIEAAGSRNATKIVRTASAQEAVSGSDIVITCTQKLAKPIVKHQWLKRGVLALPLESNRAWEDEALFGVDKFVIDDFAQGRLYQQGGAFAGGIPSVYAETGEVVAGLKKGREHDDESIMVINIGLACEDISLGTYVYEKARSKGIGSDLSLMREERLALPD